VIIEWGNVRTVGNGAIFFESDRLYAETIEK